MRGTLRNTTLGVLVCSLCLVGLISAAWGANLYGNNATFGTPYVYVMDAATMVVNQTITNLSSTNGRGVVVVGDTMYYTTANSNSVFSYTLSTSTNNGPLFTVAGASALSTMAWDGSNFWIGDYSGSNNAFLYSPTGTLLKTVSLSMCGGFCDGLEYFLQAGQGRLISNRGDPVGPYDIYDTDGNLLTAAFITTPGAAAGIAFDGTNFFVSDIFAGTISLYNGTTGAFISTTPITGWSSPYSPLVEDLSVDYTLVLPPPNGVPEPGTIGLAAIGLIGLLGRRRMIIAQI